MEDNRFYVYALVDPRTNMPFYIGKGCRDRDRQHLCKNNNENNERKKNRIDEIRNNGFEVLIKRIVKDLPCHVARNIEVYFIAKFGREGMEPDGILTNIILSRLVIGRSKTRRPRKPVDPEVAIRRGLAMRGRKRGPMSDKSRKKMRDAKLGRRLSPEHSEKLRATLVGRKCSLETRHKISTANKGRKKAP